MARSGSLAPRPLALAPCLVNNDDVTTALTLALCMRFRRDSLGPGYLVLNACMSLT